MQRAPWSDLARLRSALEANLDADIRTIADIGCGRCDECGMLLDLFPDAALTLVETDPTCIGTLNRFQEQNWRVHVVHGDGRQLGGFAPGPYDLAIIRHPDLDAQRSVWAEVLRAAAAQLAASGRLMVTTYTPAEAEFARKILRSLPVEELRSVSSGLAPVTLAGNDRFILTWKRFDL